MGIIWRVLTFATIITLPNDNPQGYEPYNKILYLPLSRRVIFALNLVFEDNIIMTLSEQLCLQFCPYYKASKDESLACRGFVEVKRLIEKGGRIVFRDSGRPVATETVRALARKMCPVCPFYKGDCDFISMVGKASPCGGFLLLGQLVDDGTISVDDLGQMD
jgi:hypothetical protein